jgi:hypothetical protein
MTVDVDGAPNAYGPPGKPALDNAIDAHYLERADEPIVGYLLDEKHRPVVQGPKDPFPGYYISQTAFTDPANPNERDPRSYVDARNINYVVRGNYAQRHGVKVGDFVAVYSRRTHRAVFGIVGDTGNPSGDEGSLHLLQDLGYPFHDGISDSVTRPEIVIRFYPNSNPQPTVLLYAGCAGRSRNKARPQPQLRRRAPRQNKIGVGENRLRAYATFRSKSIARLRSSTFFSTSERECSGPASAITPSRSEVWLFQISQRSTSARSGRWSARYGSNDSTID